MSEEELQIVNEALVPVFQSGDMVEIVDDDSVWESLEARLGSEAQIRFITPDGGGLGSMGEPLRGVDGLRAGWREWLDPWESYKILPQGVIEASEGRVLALVESRGRLRGGGGEISQAAAALAQVESERIIAVDFYLDQAQARREAGLA